MLKKIRKKNEVTNRNLEETLLSKLESHVDLDTNALSLYTFIENFKSSKLIFIGYLS